MDVRTITGLAAAVTLLVSACSGTESPTATTSESAAGFTPVTVTDCKGDDPHTFDAAPQHIITSNNAGADLLALLGAGGQVLGLGWARGLDTLPPDVQQELSHAERLSDGNIDKETLLTAGGDMFLATFASMEMMGTPEPTPAEYRAAHLPKVYIKSSACAAELPGPRTDLAQVYEDIDTLAAITGHPGAGQTMVSGMKDEIAEAQKAIPADAPRPTVFHIDVAASKDSFNTPGNRQIANAIYTLAGLHPLGADANTAFTRFSYEQLVAADPDWITVAVRRTDDDATIAAAQDAAIESLKSDPRTKDLRAVTGDKFIRTTSEDMTLAGPQNAQQVVRIVGQVYGS